MAENGLLRVISSEELDRAEREESEREGGGPEKLETGLLAHIRHRFEIMRNHRESSGIDERILRALRVFNGEYDPQVLAAIRQMQGSEVYSRVVGTKARGATALLRDIYFSQGRPWSLKPTPSPTIPDDIGDAIPRIVEMEVQAARQQGAEIDPAQVQERLRMLNEQAEQQTRVRAAEEAHGAERQIDDFLREGGFYEALGELLIDVPLFPFSVMKGPVVRMADQIKYTDEGVDIVQQPKLFWKRVSPFDFFFLPGAQNIRDTEICERMRWSRKDLNDLIGLPGWDEESIREAIDDYDTGLRDWLAGHDNQRAVQEDREDPTWNRSGMIDALEYHGNVKGEMLLEIGFTEEEVPDPQLDYFVEAWVVGRHLLKAQLSPSPRKRHPYFVTSFEKVPGTIMGHALPDMLSDIGDVANAALRNLVNNMGIASGPQVVVNTDRIAPEEDPNNIYPWKRWYTVDDPIDRGGSARVPPVDFYQPASNAQELMGIYQKMTEIADEISAIPRYVTGSGAPGGAGRTASGLSMLMGNASKILQQVAYNVDTDIMQETLTSLYELLMVVDGGVDLRGDENIVVKGVTTVLAKETERARQLEFLQLTANPFDQQIMGVDGRAEVLRAIARDLNLDGDVNVVPGRREMKERMEQAMKAQQANAEAQQTADQGERPGGGDNQVTNNVQPGFNTGGI